VTAEQNILLVNNTDPGSRAYAELLLEYRDEPAAE